MNRAINCAKHERSTYMFNCKKSVTVLARATRGNPGTLVVNVKCKCGNTLPADSSEQDDQTTEPADEKTGCKSALAGAVLTVGVTLGAATVLGKKKKD